MKKFDILDKYGNKIGEIDDSNGSNSGSGCGTIIFLIIWFFLSIIAWVACIKSLFAEENLKFGFIFILAFLISSIITFFIVYRTKKIYYGFFDFVFKFFLYSTIITIILHIFDILIFENQFEPVGLLLIIFLDLLLNFIPSLVSSFLLYLIR